MTEPGAPSATLHCAKYHGLGNDFLVVLADAVPPRAAELARALCERRTGVGADGLVVGTPSARAGIDLVFHLWNADGGVAEISGNGIRCLAHAEARRRGVDNLDLRVETLAGDRDVTVRPGRRAHEITASVTMGKPAPGPALGGVPRAPGVDASRATTVDVGNPHLVLLVDDPDRVDVATAGPLIEAGFPGGINVHFVAPRTRDVLRLRVWERGAGVTAACGSGAVAAAYAAHEWGLVGEHVRVEMPGGDADVVLGDQLTLVGPSVFVAEVIVPIGAIAHD
ncbi:MAG TPA: diaminopimelate epimerase [Acidimicrobiales bacterium]